MAAGCSIVASDTPPVREVIRHGLTDFCRLLFFHVNRRRRWNRFLTQARGGVQLSESAMETAETTDRCDGLQAWMGLCP